ncbi:ATP-dependent RNA helicase DEAH12, chloroplastic [Elaeis guineensis]|uniref:RNA helicase n=1 Tax=Elaeis guineensis var. tenera TaxID=51953 RepID=A0A6I9RGH8_ELAGV|nr:ATP-dependent RNA helicase DEAH12, chloroplastic [Elaeis guineensis]
MRRGGYPDRCLGRPPFRPERPLFRQERLPFRPQPQAYHRHWQQPPAPRPRFVVVLVCSPSTQKGLSSSYIRDLLVSCPSTPENFFYSQGAVVGKFIFRCWADALEASVYLWGRRLDGAHHLTAKIESSTGLLPSLKAEEESRLRALFTGHIRGLLECEAVRRCEGKIEQVEHEIKKVSGKLTKPIRLATIGKIQDTRKSLEAEKEQLESRLKEFRAAMECLIAYLSEQQEVCEEEEGKVEIFKLQGELDWSRIHHLMERECRRFEDGLPLYACRRKILSHIFSNQVLVLIGETGSGKSTQLVQYLADAGLAADGSILCTQPRKIAAISLAQRVGEESNGCYADNFVISHPTYSSFQKFNSRLIFMTDHCLLQHCMNDMSLSGISYIIVDEAHERSLNTDLLLALIKKKLLERLDLRLIIMSATADAGKLAEYFYGCYTLYVKGRNFPVEIKYIPDISAPTICTTTLTHTSGIYASYVGDVIKMVRIIHKTETDGSILAFLTSQMEVEWACENFHDPSAVVLPMHGKLSYEEQSRVFQKYPGKRKVIFSTNVAETSLTIQDVKYVVDSGMVKESRYEPGNGMNVLKVGRISQSSASQRAGRAGRTAPGKCYRLYSECDFYSMKTHPEPEIRKVHLGIAVLRILALGIKNVQDFEFVDAPSPQAIDIAMQNLVQLGAVTNNADVFKLTDTGWSLVKLGIEPRLGKIILDCFGRGLRKEGLVLAAVMANASSIFCRVGSDEDKYKADRLKVPFCHRYGDLFTLLSVYKKWEDKRENKNKWCWQNSINAKSMRRCQETVVELENCLQHELNIIIPNYWLWDPDKPNLHDQILKKIILSSLAENVAMFSGCDRVGYEVALTGQLVQLHPSSSLLMFSQKPNWVVFGEILSISNQYLVCVTAVDSESLCVIQPPLFDIQQLESRRMQMNVIPGVGSNLLKRFCGKHNQNLQRIISHIQKVCMDDRIGIDVDFGKSEIQVFASPKDMEKACCIVNDALEYETKWLRDECVEKYLFPGRPGSSLPVALFGSGAEIKHLELEKRHLTVEISHPNAHAVDDKEVLLMVDQCVSGIANYHKYAGNGPEGTDKWGKITFLSPAAAENAVAKLNEVEFHGSLLKALPVRAVDNKLLPFSAVRARVCWPRRPSKGAALITCAGGEAEFIVRDCFALVVGGRYVNCQVSTKYKNCVFVTGLPRDVSETELYDAFLSSTERKILDIHLLRGEPIPNPPGATCREALVREISAFMPKKNFRDHSFQIEVFNPEPKDYMMKAIITFDGGLHLEAAKALDHIQGKVLPGCLSWQKIRCEHVFHSHLSCPARVYFVIKKQLDSLLESFQQQKGVSYNLEKNDNGSCRVKISANATKTIADLRRPLEQLMKGKTISHPSLTPTVLQLLFSRDGVALLKAVERKSGTYILYDRQNLNVKVFGPPKEVAAAEQNLVQSLLSLHEDRQLEIRLRGRNIPPNLMKEVVQRFGPDLQGLKEMVPGAELTLNTRSHIINVRGNNELKRRVEEVISEVALSVDHAWMIKQPSGTSCPICLCELEEPYRLEACGHDFCRSCLVDQLESTIRSRDSFPIGCTKEGCNELILLVDLRSLLPSEKMEELFRASLGAFVASRGGAYRFCPSPDCPSVYQVAPKDAEAGHFVCGACSVETCTKCHLEYHPFISCERYKEYKEDPDLSLVEWRKGKEYIKDCPACGYTIEKIDGCNHIECKCGRHICWVCLEFFRSSDECYGHLRSEHQYY